MEIDPNCKYCETYFTSRNEFIKIKKQNLEKKQKIYSLLILIVKILIVKLLNN